MATTGTSRTPRPSSSPTRRNGRRTTANRRSPFRAVKIFFQICATLILLGILAATAIVAVEIRDAPTAVDLDFDPPGRIEILSSDGRPLAQISTQNRQVVGIDKVPTDLQHATIAFEDKRFYEHSGVDIVGTMRALVRNISTGDLKGQGGSTITQQLARNLGVGGLTMQKTFQRKVHEWVVSNQIEKNYTKQQILGMYLNAVNYGSGAYGVQAAAQTYFGKNVQDLDLAQCALLAGIPNRPATFSPYKDMNAATEQRNVVLQHMLDQSYITQSQYTAAVGEKIKLAYSKPPGQGTQIYNAPFFVNYVLPQLHRLYPEDVIRAGNLKVYTTLNYKMQQIAEQAVNDGLARQSSRRGPNQACLIAMDPKTGEIKALVGGSDYKKSNFDIATQSYRQPGSLFKAIVYSAAIDSGAVTEDTRVFDGPITYGTNTDPYRPHDDDGFSYRSVTLRKAVAYSINVPAVKVLNMIGPETAIRYARVMGINESTHLDPVLSLALGSSAVTPLEMTTVYATVANGGYRVTPNPFIKVTDMDGQTLNDFPATSDQVLQPDTAKQVDDMLRAVVTEGTAYGGGTTDQAVPDARGKTGTTQGHKDVWFIGYTPDLVCCVWAGHPLHNKKSGLNSYGLEMPGRTWGATVCVPIWRDFMSQALPIFRASKANETRKAKADEPTHVAAKVKTNSDSEKVQNTNQSSAPAAGSMNAPPSTTKPASDSSANAASDTVTVNVDNDTGLLAPVGSPNSGEVNFEKGQEPTEMAPAYAHSDNTTATVASQAPAPVTTPSTQITTDTTNTRPRHRHHRADGNTSDGTSQNAVPPPDMVTVRINPEDGLLATKWCPEVVEKSFLRGTQPRRHSRMYGPPPGEH